MDYALVKEQGVTFAVVIVKNHVMQNQSSKEDAIESFRHYFPQVPIILMSQNIRGVPQYYGRKDIVQFLSKIDHRRLPWKRKHP
jgi:hypothetical protein